MRVLVMVQTMSSPLPTDKVQGFVPVTVTIVPAPFSFLHSTDEE